MTDLECKQTIHITWILNLCCCQSLLQKSFAYWRFANFSGDPSDTVIVLRCLNCHLLISNCCFCCFSFFELLHFSVLFHAIVVVSQLPLVSISTNNFSGWLYFELLNAMSSLAHLTKKLRVQQLQQISKSVCANGRFLIGNHSLYEHRININKYFSSVLKCLVFCISNVHEA